MLGIGRAQTWNDDHGKVPVYYIGDASQAQRSRAVVTACTPYGRLEQLIFQPEYMLGDHLIQ
jgi:hypothetical protein